MAAAILGRELVKTYDGGVQAVRGIDLEVQSGECFGLLGPNGAGKTTTIEMLEGLLRPTSGEVSILGRSYDREEELIRQRLGVTLQETRFPEKLTVEETLELFGSFYARRRDPDALLQTIGLAEKRKAWVVTLSGGQKQRLSLACALVGEPDVLFLDEPTTGLDPQSRRHLWELVRGFRREGTTVLLTTHYMEEAERLCDRIAVVDHGKVIATGTPRELIARLGGDHVIEVGVGELVERSDLEAAHLEDLPSVRGVHREGGDLVLTVSEVHVALPALLERLESRSLSIEHLSTRHASLEDVFVSLTGRHLRDE